MRRSRECCCFTEKGREGTRDIPEVCFRSFKYCLGQERPEGILGRENREL